MGQVIDLNEYKNRHNDIEFSYSWDPNKTYRIDRTELNRVLYLLEIAEEDISINLKICKSSDMNN